MQISGGGYDVAWDIPGANTYSVWTTNSSGSYLSNVVPQVTGTSIALETIETTFQQDLNGDGVVGLYAAPGTALIIDQTLSGASGVATIGAGATLTLEAADSASVTFTGTTGTLIIDHSNVFTAQVIGFTGNGTLAGSDVIDVKDVDNATATKSFNGTTTSGTLTVSDAEQDTANISLVGNYMTSTFTLSGDGGVGTLVIDPPMWQTTSGAVASFANSAGVGAAASVSMPLQNVILASTEIKPVVAVPVRSVDTLLVDVGRISSVIVASTNAVRASSDELQIAVAQPSAGSYIPHASDMAFARPGGMPGEGRPSDQPIDPQREIKTTALLSSPPTTVASSNAIAREVVSADDIIRAIKASDISIRRGDAVTDRAPLTGQVWLFDEAEGTFVPPEPEPLTIVLERGETKSGLGQRVEALGLLATAAMVSTESSWLDSLRQFGRKAARVVQPGSKWIE